MSASRTRIGTIVTIRAAIIPTLLHARADGGKCRPSRTRHRRTDLECGFEVEAWYLSGRNFGHGNEKDNAGQPCRADGPQQLRRAAAGPERGRDAGAQ